MKKNCLLTLLILTGLQVMAQQNAAGILLRSKSLAGKKIQSLRAETTTGDILVRGTEDTKARIEVFVKPGSKSGYRTKNDIEKDIAENYDLLISVSGHHLAVSSKAKPGVARGGESLALRFVIYLPVNASSHIQTSGGNIELQHLSGVQDLLTSGGNVEIANVKGRIKALTSGGNILLENASDVIDLTTSGGNIRAEKSSGNVTLVTSGGSIFMADLKGTVNATSGSGAIHANGIDGMFKCSSSGGNLLLENMSCTLDAFAAGGKMDIDMLKIGKSVNLFMTGFGNISLKVPGHSGMGLDLLGEVVELSPPTGFKGNDDEHHLEGTLAGGGALVKVSGAHSIVLVKVK